MQIRNINDDIIAGVGLKLNNAKLKFQITKFVDRAGDHYE